MVYERHTFVLKETRWQKAKKKKKKKKSIIYFFPVGYWSSPQNRRLFFIRYAEKHGFDPLIASNWYSLSFTHLRKERVSLFFVEGGVGWRFEMHDLQLNKQIEKPSAKKRYSTNFLSSVSIGTV
jgi:hypothetical protein